jgi:FkbM family methyltransferase
MQRRVKVLHRAANSSNHDVRIAYAFKGNEQATIHRYIGNQEMPDSVDYEIQNVQGLRLTRLARFIGEPIRIMKIDCEGCEMKFLNSQAISRVQEIIGEYHAGYEQLEAILARSHNVERLVDEGGFGLFHARAR